jgi:TetR/AcrR family transcriptional regulator
VVKRRRRNAEATRREALAAAERLFARKGYGGTSLHDVARASGVSQPLLQHHFGGKAGLWRAVQARVMERFTRFWPRDEGRPFAAELHEALRALFRILTRDTCLLRLFSWTRLEDTPGLWPGEREALEDVCGRIRKAQRQGQIRADLDPMLLTIILTAMVLYWCDERERLAGVFAHGQVPDEAYLETVVSVVSRGIEGR